MLATSLTVYTHDAKLLSFVQTLSEHNVAVINSAVFNAGFLTGGQFFDYRKITGANPGDAELIAWRERFHELCSRFSVLPAEACVAFGMSPPGIVATALSSVRADRTAQNVNMCNATPPNEFWLAMKESKLLDADYPYLGIV